MKNSNSISTSHNSRDRAMRRNLSETYLRHLKLRQQRQNYDSFDFAGFEQYLNDFIEDITVRGYSGSTIDKARRVLPDYARLVAGKGIKSVLKVDRAFWRVYSGYLWESGLSRRAIYSRQSTIRAFYKFLVDDDVIPASPFSTCSLVKYEAALPHFLSVTEAMSIIEAPDMSTATGLRDRAILELFYTTGLRLSELEGLNVDSLKLSECSALVFGKGHKERYVLYPEATAGIMTQYLETARPELLNGINTEALFLNYKGERIDKRTIQKLLKEYADKAGVSKNVHPHIFRHSFATHLLDGHADLRVIQELLGHSSISTTQIYTHVSLEHIRRTYSDSHPLAHDKESAVAAVEREIERFVRELSVKYGGRLKEDEIRQKVRNIYYGAHPLATNNENGGNDND
jgi:site-specific recombinase XerD